MYQSPFHILQASEINKAFLGDKEALRRLRKKLLAEFDLQQKNEVQLGNRTYSKDDIIKVIDALMENVDFELHAFIYTHRPLLFFLEEADKDRHHLHSMPFVPDELKPRLSPLLTAAFRQRMQKALNSANFKKAGELLFLFPDWYLADKQQLLDTIYDYLHSTEEEIKSVVGSDLSNMHERLPSLKVLELSIFLNQLPPKMDDIKNSLVSAIINSIVYYSKLDMFYGYYAYRVSVMLTNIKCDAELMTLIKTNHMFFKRRIAANNSHYNKVGGTKYGQSVRNLAIILVIVMLLLKIGVEMSEEKNRNTEPDIALLNAQILNNMRLMYGAHRPQYYNFRVYQDYYIKTPKDILNAYGRIVLPDSNITNGQTPFRELTSANADTLLLKERLQKVILENRSGLKLIAFLVDSVFIWNAIYKSGTKDTLRYLPEQSLFLYFGDSLLTCPDCFINKEGIIWPESENHFAFFPDSAIRIFKKAYKISTSQKRKKKTLPTLLIEPSFFRKDSVVGGKVSLKRF